MKEINVLIVEISGVLVGIPQEDVEVVLPLVYDMKKTMNIYGSSKVITKVWGFATSFLYEGRNIKIIDISLPWNRKRSILKFKYLILINNKNIGIKVDSIIDIERFSVKEIYLFPIYLQKLLHLDYLWGVVMYKKGIMYLIDSGVLKDMVEAFYEKAF